MQRLRALLLTVWTVACGVLTMSSVARADERTDARREFRAGMQDVAEGKYDSGIEHLERAYDILPHPNVLYNIGLAHMYAGRADQAIEYFERYRETAPASDAVEVDSLIRSLTQTKPKETAGPEPAAGEGKGTEPRAELSSRETLAVVEAAAAEIRLLAEQQNSDALRKQANQLDAAVAKLREQVAIEAAHEAEKTPPPASEHIPAPATQPAQTIPPTAVAGQGGARQGVYEEQVVSASRLSQSPLDAPNATAIITAQDIRMAGVFQLTQLFRRVAGVEVASVTPDHSEIAIRGLNRRTSTRVLLLWDGRQVRKDFLGSIWPDLLPVLQDDIERIEIIRGPASALYGADAFSGVINVITRPAGQGGSYAVTRVGNRGQYVGGASFSGRVGKVNYRGSAGYEHADNAVTVVGKDRVDVQPYAGVRDDAIGQYMANGDVNYSYAKNGMISAGGNYGAGMFTIQGLSRLNQVVTTPAHEAQGYATLTTPVGIRVAANYDDVVGHPSAAWIAPGSVIDYRSNVRQNLLDLDLSWSDAFNLVVPNTLTLGVAYRFKHIDWDWLDGEHTQNHIGAYLQDIIQLAKPLKLQIGARVDRHPLLQNIQFSPRGSLVYRFLGEQSLRVSGGRAFRGPSFIESYVHYANETPLRGVTAWGQGNTHLNPESITSIEVGYQNQQSDYFSLECNLYYNWIKDAILFTANDRFTLSDFSGDNVLAAYNQIAQAYPVSALSFANERAVYRQMGGELGARIYPMEGLDLYTNYSIHDTSPLDKSKVDPARAKEQQTSRHKVNGGFQYRTWFGLELSSDVSWVSKQLWIEQVNDVANGGIRWQQYPQPAFLMVNARIGYRLFGDRLEVGVSGTNLTFNHNRQQPISQPLDTRVLGSAKVRF